MKSRGVWLYLTLISSLTVGGLLSLSACSDLDPGAVPKKSRSSGTNQESNNSGDDDNGKYRTPHQKT